MKLKKKTNENGKKLVFRYFLSYWKKLFLFFGLPLMLLIILLSFYNEAKNELYAKNYRAQEFFEVSDNFNEIFEEIVKNYSNLMTQEEVAQYITSNKTVPSDTAVANLRKLLTNSIVSMPYIRELSFYCFENEYVVSTQNGNSIENFHYKNFYSEYLQEKNPNSITTEKSNYGGVLRDIINISYGYYQGTRLEGIFIYSIDAHALVSALYENREDVPYNIIFSTSDGFYYCAPQEGISKKDFIEITEKTPYSDENTPVFSSFNDSYAYKIKHELMSLELCFVKEKAQSGGIFSIWVSLIAILVINLILIIFALILTRQFRQQLINLTFEFMQRFSLEGASSKDYSALSKSIFDNLQRGERFEIAFPRQLLNLKKTQLYALQMQISPHFLYNTLNSINLMAMNLTKGDNDISRLIVLLSDLLHDVLDTKKYVITLKQEIEYSKKFLEIENIKRKNSVNIEWDVEKELLGCGIIKFILQPILENIFRHAFRSLQQEKTVKILGRSCDKGFYVEVSDNGMGIVPEKLEEIRKALKNGAFDGSHIGLVNVNERIHMLFGEEYGIEIYSTPMAGTTVKLTLPKTDKDLQ